MKFGKEMLTGTLIAGSLFSPLAAADKDKKTVDIQKKIEEVTRTDITKALQSQLAQILLSMHKHMLLAVAQIGPVFIHPDMWAKRAVLLEQERQKKEIREQEEKRKDERLRVRLLEASLFIKRGRAM